MYFYSISMQGKNFDWVAARTQLLVFKSRSLFCRPSVLYQTHCSKIWSFKSTWHKVKVTWRMWTRKVKVDNRGRTLLVRVNLAYANFPRHRRRTGWRHPNRSHARCSLPTPCSGAGCSRTCHCCSSCLASNTATRNVSVRRLDSLTMKRWHQEQSNILLTTWQTFP